MTGLTRLGAEARKGRGGWLTIDDGERKARSGAWILPTYSTDGEAGTFDGRNGIAQDDNQLAVFVARSNTYQQLAELYKNVHDESIC